MPGRPHSEPVWCAAWAHPGLFSCLGSALLSSAPQRQECSLRGTPPPLPPMSTTLETVALSEGHEECRCLGNRLCFCFLCCQGLSSKQVVEPVKLAAGLASQSPGPFGGAGIRPGSPRERGLPGAGLATETCYVK